MAASAGFSVIDVDSHVYEPAAIWDEYVEPAYRPLARVGLSGTTSTATANAITIVNGALAPELNRSRIVRQAIWRPGIKPADIGALDPAVFHELNPGAWDPAVRLADMDEMGIDQSIVFPTLFNEYLPMVENPDVAAVLAARVQRLGLRTLPRAASERLHPVAILPLQHLYFALEGSNASPRVGSGRCSCGRCSSRVRRWALATSG